MKTVTDMRALVRLLVCAALLALHAAAARAAYLTEWVEFPALKEFNGESVELSALQFRPQGPGPFPAVVLMHGCSGMYTPSGYVTASYRRRAEMLVEAGYVALLVDSFRPRGHWSICALQKRPILESRERMQDAYAARQWLNRQPYVATGRVGLMGWSNGGTGTLHAMRETNRMEPGFRAAIAFYPGCRTLSRAKMPYRPYAPLLLLVGEADDWTPAEPCRQLAEIARTAGAPFELVTYPDAHHSFDTINSPVRYRPDVRNLNKPDRKGATSGEHPAARVDAERRTLEFFAQRLKD
ncbi:MAG: dienelactone hydrolase family protein [Burkholderiales bacterium]|nr:dienelactone hydrolase family protein [Burkholderiales bacterium]